MSVHVCACGCLCTWVQTSVRVRGCEWRGRSGCRWLCTHAREQQNTLSPPPSPAKIPSPACSNLLSGLRSKHTRRPMTWSESIPAPIRDRSHSPDASVRNLADGGREARPVSAHSGESQCCTPPPQYTTFPSLFPD